MFISVTSALKIICYTTILSNIFPLEPDDFVLLRCNLHLFFLPFFALICTMIFLIHPPPWSVGLSFEH